jgi:hypothetical protein
MPLIARIIAKAKKRFSKKESQISMGVEIGWVLGAQCLDSCPRVLQTPGGSMLGGCMRVRAVFDRKEGYAITREH